MAVSIVSKKLTLVIKSQVMCKREIKVTMLVCGRPEMRFGPPLYVFRALPLGQQICGVSHSS